MYRDRHAKILATLGPASSTPDMIASLHEAGVDVFRLNFSHGAHHEHEERLAAIRRIERRTGRPIGVVADLQGPKLRLGAFANGEIELRQGQSFRLDLDEAEGDETRVQLPHPEIFQAVGEGDHLLLDDGKVRVEIVESGMDHAETRVIHGRRLSNRKGVNVPGVVLPISPLTDKDRRDLRFALDIGVDWIALSFVQRPEDVAEARRLIGGRAQIMIKFEKPSAIDRMQELIELGDAVMVARGDLGVEMPPEDVPAIQKRLIRTARHLGKPVIVATQMLESMISSPQPTRAEASDVATAVYDGADAVMLSAETAAGDYPLEAVSIMARIIARVEGDPHHARLLHADAYSPEATSADAISAAARQVANTISAGAIVTYTTSGSTTLRASRERPSAPIIGLTSNLATARRLSLAWGVHSIHGDDVASFAEMVQVACSLARQQGFVDAGDRVVITAGVPFGTPGATNILRIAWIEPHH